MRDFGRVDSAFRTAEQTDIAFFWSENPYVHWNRNLTRLAISHNLDVRDTARLFAMVHTAVSDAIIVGFEAKYHYEFWRPRTSIPQRRRRRQSADRVRIRRGVRCCSVNHPEYPSGHGFWSGALLYAVESFFQSRRGDLDARDVEDRRASPRKDRNGRTPVSTTLETEIRNARVWGGLHYRNSINVGEQIGDGIALVVLSNHFRRIE